MLGTSKRSWSGDEFVEDSEPERQAKRQKSKELAGRLVQKKSPSLHLRHINQPDQYVTELANTERNPIDGPTSAVVRPQSPIDKLASVSRKSPSPGFDRMDFLFSEKSPSLLPAITTFGEPNHRNDAIDTKLGPYSAQNKSNTTHRYPTPPPITTLESLLSSDSEDEPRLKLSRFAFQAVYKTETGKPGVSSRSVSTVAPQTLSKPSSAPKARTKRAKVHRFSDDFSNRQLASLTNCVSCNLKWTSKKTASQKMVHIQNCAKNKCLSDQTVKMLILKEIGSSCNQDSPEAIGQTTAEEGEKSTTFLETIVNHIPQKTGRRPQVLGTIKSLPETRGSILGKARAVLDASMQHSNSAVLPERVQAGADGVPCTQAFGTSMLARRADSYSSEQLGLQMQASSESTLSNVQ